MFDLRSFSLDDMYRCSAELRSIGEAARDADDAANRIVTYFYEALLTSETRQPACRLVRLFRTLPFSSLSPKDASAVRAVGGDVGPDTIFLSLRATRGVEPEWNDPALSRHHRLLPLMTGPKVPQLPMVSALVEQLGIPAGLRSVAPSALEEMLPWFNVFHVEHARGSPFVPEQQRFVEPYGIESVLGIGGVLPPGEVFVVILFSRVTIAKWTAELFRTLAPSVGLALLRSGRNERSSEVRTQAYEQVVRQHERIALTQHQQLREVADDLARSLAERQRFEALVENSSDLIGIADPDQRLTYLNPAGRQMVGLSPTFDVTKTRIGDYYVPDARARMDDVLSSSTVADWRWAGETALRNWESEAAIPVSDHHFTIREPGTNRLLGLGMVMRDISSERRAEQERERLLASAQESRAEAQSASRAKDDFLAALGHELRNPLSPIVTAIELMKLRGTRSREQEIIERQALQLGRLVDDLLDVARIARGDIEIRKRPVEIGLIVARASEMASPLFEQRKQRLTVDVPGQGLLVNADLGRLAQVVSNILNNASKYSPVGSGVGVSAERAGDLVRLRVRDQGVGIPRELLDSIFDSFVRHSRPDQATGGLGLGLTIARKLAQLHGGTVFARSEGQGKGSEFVVELPSVAATTEPATTNVEPPPSEERRKMRVLLVDDNEDAASMLGDALSELGYEVLVAYDSPSALQLAPEFKPQVALLDIGLPLVDGYELARRLRDLPGMSKDIRLIAVTGYGQESDRRRSIEAGFAAHLVKPVALDTLVAALRA